MIEIKILGNKWKVHVLEGDEYVRVHGDSDAAHTSPVIREICFNEDELSRSDVTHELVHACYAETCVSSANLTPDQVEEVMCEMFAIHGNKLLTLSRRLYKELKDESGR